MAAKARGARPSARSTAYASIRDGIINATLAPGALLSENELAIALGLSRQPVREALLLVAQEGLVEIRPQSGTYVTLIDAGRVREAQFIREAIELTSLRSASAPVGTQEEEIREVICHQRASANRDSFYSLDEAFHRLLLGLSGHADAWAAVSAAKGHLDRVRYLALSASRGVQDYVDDHERVIDALVDGDLDTAVNELRAHLRFVFADMLATQERHPEYFENVGTPPTRTGRAARQ